MRVSIIVLAITSLLFGCQSKKSVSVIEFSGIAMTMEYRILIGETLKTLDNHEIKEVIVTTFQEIDRLYNKWNPHSELSRLNRIQENTPVEISEKLSQFLQKTETVVTLSDGRFDPTIEPLQQLWKQQLQKGETPSEQAIAAIIPALGWDKIHFTETEFYKNHRLTALDLGGIAKGFGVDLLVENLNNKGYPNIYVEWGGEIRASGVHPDQRPWNVFISNLGSLDPDQAIGIVELNNQAVATSGDYLQNWQIGPLTYFHIFDWKRQRPLTTTSRSIASVTIRAQNCAIADGLATAAMTFDTVDDAERWLSQIKQNLDIDYWVVDRTND